MNWKAPSVELEMTGSGRFKFGDYKDKLVVLYFYPKDSTPGCTQEGHDFSNLISQFKKYAYVFGVSRDSLKSHENFKAKQAYKLDLISDAEEILCKAFDVIKEKNMYGKKVMGIVRSTFVIDQNQKVIAEWRKVKIEGHAEEVLSFCKDIN